VARRRLHEHQPDTVSSIGIHPHRGLKKMELAAQYDGIPRNPIKRKAKELVGRGLGALQSLPGYHTGLRAVNTLSGAENVGWQRKVMYEKTKAMVEELVPSNLDVLEISGDHWGSLLSFRSYKSVEFPEYDVCDAPLSQQFDLVIADQVFEHLLWPYRAARNVYEMTRPGGYFLVMTPFLVRVHPHPTDCSRWTETGLRHFLAECGFPLEQTKTGSWGNLSCVRAELTHFHTYRRRFHSLRDQHQYPVVVWALAQKPA
jgi:SAM-dependent methyltransferase